MNLRTLIQKKDTSQSFQCTPTTRNKRDKKNKFMYRFLMFLNSKERNPQFLRSFWLWFTISFVWYFSIQFNPVRILNLESIERIQDSFHLLYRLIIYLSSTKWQRLLGWMVKGRQGANAESGNEKFCTNWSGHLWDLEFN